MAASDKYRRIADRYRALPDKFGLREHTVTLVYSRWTGGRIGEGEEELTEYPITVGSGAPPKVRFPSQREIALGAMSEGSVSIGPFTPEYGTGGVKRSMFDCSTLKPGEGMHIRVMGPQHPTGCLYRIKNNNVDRALRVTLTCIPAEG